MIDRAKSINSISNEELGHNSDILRKLAYTYIVCFGNTEGVNEGGISLDGNRISLNEYLNFMLTTQLFNKSVKPITLENLSSPIDALDSKASLDLLKWVDSLDDDRRIKLFEETFNRSSGYHPFSTAEGVLSRFSEDLDPTRDLTPLISYWSDLTYEVCGYDAIIVVQNKKRLSQIFQNMPYITSDSDILLKIDDSLDSNLDITFPVVLFYETGVLPERKGSINGSLWTQLALKNQIDALGMGVKQAIGITFPESKIYKGLEKRGEFKVTDSTGSLVFFVMDLQKSVNSLVSRINE